MSKAVNSKTTFREAKISFGGTNLWRAWEANLLRNYFSIKRQPLARF